MENLQKVSTYAIKNGISSTWVYKLIEEGKLVCKIIDGVKFIVVESKQKAA